jgi:hypothetical protein
MKNAPQSGRFEFCLCVCLVVQVLRQYCNQSTALNRSNCFAEAEEHS